MRKLSPFALLLIFSLKAMAQTSNPVGLGQVLYLTPGNSAYTSPYSGNSASQPSSVQQPQAAQQQGVAPTQGNQAQSYQGQGQQNPSSPVTRQQQTQSPQSQNSNSQTQPSTDIQPSRPVGFDYSVNLNSDVFGAQLFSGAFARQGATQFNPDYLVAVGDRLQVRMWGAYELDASFVVDPKGNIFLPHIGPVRVLSVRNQDLQTVVDNSIRRVYKANVYSYASLAAAQPVRVFVSGFVYRPGLYSGTSMDSLLHYIDQAGGIDVERGSFLDIQVKRNGETRAKANLYEFLLQGRIPQVQLSDGDVIFVSPRKHTARVTGLVENAKRFEFEGDKYSIGDLARIAKPLAATTHARISRNTGSVLNTEYYPLSETSKVALVNGDQVDFTADKKPGTISVRVEGEHLSPQEYVLPYGSKMADLMSKIQLNERSDAASTQLFRLSVKERQKLMLSTSLKSLESAALTARSATGEEAVLRRNEAELLLQWVERAKTIEPSGQVFIAEAQDQGEMLLENGDVVRIPTRDALVLISGEILFPNAIVFDQKLTVDDYIKRAGGYTQNADVSRVIIAHRDGSFNDAKNDGASIRAGDQILVLPKIDTKSRQFFKDITQIIYQIAVSAKVVFGL
jgi:protein involved in polysaccharide export with SLBB domain